MNSVTACPSEPITRKLTGCTPAPWFQGQFDAPGALLVHHRVHVKPHVLNACHEWSSRFWRTLLRHGYRIGERTHRFAPLSPYRPALGPQTVPAVGAE